MAVTGSGSRRDQRSFSAPGGAITILPLSSSFGAPVAGLSSPQYLAANASALGMVVGQTPNYLRLSDGAIVGTGKAASSSSSVHALSRAAVTNALVSGVPLVTDPDASLQSGVTVDQTLLLNTPTPPAIADGLPTPATH